LKIEDEENANISECMHYKKMLEKKTQKRQIKIHFAQGQMQNDRQTMASYSTIANS